MAKELPYFKFEPAEYLTKDISFCSLSAQGLFMNICSYYWQRNCKLTKSQLLKRLNYETELNELIKEGVIDLDNENISIKFLDLQLEEVVKTSKQNSKNGSKGGRPKKANKNPTETETKPTALIPLSETKGIREDKIILDEIKKNNIIEFKKQLEKDTYYLEQLAMSKKTKVKYLIKFIDEFQIGYAKKNYPNFDEYKRHFFNWLNKQDINSWNEPSANITF